MNAFSKIPSHATLLAQAKWNALRDAADAYSELSEFARREKQWLLQRVSTKRLVPANKCTQL